MRKILCLIAVLALIFAACKKEMSVDTGGGPSTPAGTDSLKVNKSSISFPAQMPAIDSFVVQTNVAWKIAVTPANANWFTLSQTGGAAGGNVYITLTSANADDTVKTATITISAVNNASLQPVTVSVTQEKLNQTENAFGGTGLDEFTSVVKTPDGGFIAVGQTNSKNGDVSGLHGNWEDVWVVKFNAQQKIVWSKVFGGTGRDWANKIIPAHGSGYLIIAAGNSSDGDIVGNHSSGASDLWVLKIDDQGAVIWKKCYGGSLNDGAFSVIQSTDGGYVFAGSSQSIDGDVAVNKGTQDAWILKIDGAGNKVWSNTVGGTWDDGFLSVAATTDGGFIAVGESQSIDGDLIGTGRHGTGYNYDVLTVKFDAGGNVQWKKCYGGSEHEHGWTIAATGDGSYLIAGDTESNDDDFTGNHGGKDGFVMKIDGSGNKAWQKVLGGQQRDWIWQIVKTSDNNFLLVGECDSPEVDPVNHKGGDDGWAIKINSGGTQLAQRLWGGTDEDWFYGVVEVSPGTYMAAGIAYSNDKDIIGFGGYGEGWLMKIKL